jgi:hypothetical protein
MHQYTADLANRQAAQPGNEVHLVTTANLPRDRYSPAVRIHTPVVTHGTGFSREGLNLPALRRVLQIIDQIAAGSGQRGPERGQRSEDTLHSPLPTPHSPPPHSPLPTPHSPLPTPHPPLPTPHPPLPTPHSPLPTPHSPLPTPHSPLPTPHRPPAGRPPLEPGPGPRAAPPRLPGDPNPARPGPPRRRALPRADPPLEPADAALGGSGAGAWPALSPAPAGPGDRPRPRDGRAAAARLPELRSRPRGRGAGASQRGQPAVGALLRPAGGLQRGGDAAGGGRAWPSQAGQTGAGPRLVLAGQGELARHVGRDRCRPASKLRAAAHRRRRGRRALPALRSCWCCPTWMLRSRPWWPRPTPLASR